MNQDEAPKRRWWKMVVGGLEPLQWLVAIVVSVIVAAILYRILFARVEIKVTANESAAVAAAGGQLVQMAQWTISTVLTLGTLLIGFNWFQNARERTALEATMQDVRDLTENLEERFAALELATLFAWDSQVDAAILAESDKQHYPLPTPPDYFISLFRKENATYKDKRTAAHLIAFTADRQLQRNWLDVRSLQELFVVVPEVISFDETTGRKLMDTILQGLGRMDQTMGENQQS